MGHSQICSGTGSCTYSAFSTNEGEIVRMVPGSSLPDGQQPASNRSDYRLPPVPLDVNVAIDNAELGKVPSRTISRIVS